MIVRAAVVLAVAKKKQGIRRGVKEVTKALRKGEKGYVCCGDEMGNGIRQ